MKRMICLFLVFIMLSSLCFSAYAAPVNENSINASNYLSSYSILLTPLTNHMMGIGVDVEAKRQMSFVGVAEIYIEEYSDLYGDWIEYDVWYGSSNPSLYYAYNSWDYTESFSFAGTPGKKYRVTFTCIAVDSTGSDTGTVISYARYCT